MLKDNAISTHIIGDNNTVAGRDVNITNVVVNVSIYLQRSIPTESTLETEVKPNDGLCSDSE
ncbi:hypothetical protein [Aggregatibacter sp. 2125159857]|uniref:hypothetical protein n=1 Tax=Aggregatibacter sp. 2125159857 TaxID=2820817 RepID=UPI001ADFAB9D|nr:hypothetical protein [Aggregatibacter sp. 2125159857]QTO01700.1 hypothetical protein J5X96_01325 [Aggregatibacter sp. 2125159857]